MIVSQNIIVPAPIIFSHSGARAICSNPRNVPDDVLERVAEVGGVVMVNFYACFLIDNCGDEDATVLDVVKHINHIRSEGKLHGGIFNIILAEKLLELTM